MKPLPVSESCSVNEISGQEGRAGGWSVIELKRTQKEVQNLFFASLWQLLPRNLNKLLLLFVVLNRVGQKMAI